MLCLLSVYQLQFHFPLLHTHIFYNILEVYGAIQRWFTRTRSVISTHRKTVSKKASLLPTPFYLNYIVGSRLNKSWENTCSGILGIRLSNEGNILSISIVQGILCVVLQIRMDHLPTFPFRKIHKGLHLHTYFHTISLPDAQYNT